MSDTQTRTHITQVGTVIVPVSDQDRALDFYTETLGFEKRADIPYGRGDRWAEVAPARAATSIALVPLREGEPVGIDTHVGFTTNDIDVDAEVMRMGAPIPPMFFFRDPDGNRSFIVEQG